MKQITTNVYTEDQLSVPPKMRGCNPSFVTTSEGIVLIDSPMDPRNAFNWRDDLARRGEILYIINTHHHIDHITGNAFLPGIIISHEGTRKMFTAPVEQVVATERIDEAKKMGQGMVGYMRLLIGEREPDSIPLMENYQPRLPSITFTENLTLYVGKHTFNLILLPGHTPSHIGVYVPEEKVFFAGDNVTTRTQPAMSHCLPLEWIQSLKKIESMYMDVVVPGHGVVCDKSVVREFRLFIETCVNLVNEAIKQGLSAEETADKLNFEGLYPSDRSVQAVHPGKEMQRRNVLRLYETLSKKA
jgi:cyclase